MKAIFTESAKRDMQKLPSADALRIVKKMYWFSHQDNPLSFAEPLKNFPLGSHRFRVGSYRVFVDIQRGQISILLVLAVRSRKDAYKIK